MSGYAAGEQKVADIIRTIDGFDGDNVISLANNTPPGGYDLLDSGASRDYVYLMQGNFTVMDRTMTGTKHYTWTTLIDLWVRFKRPGETEARLHSIAKKILDVFAQYRQLGNAEGVMRSELLSGEAPTYRNATGDPKDRRVAWLRQVFTLEWVGIVEPTIID